MTREATGVCLRVLKESNKSSFDSYSVRNSVLIISHITFRDCRVHIKFLSDNLSWNSCILVQVFRWPLCFPVQSFEVNFHTENMAARSGNGQGKNFFKVDEKSGNFTLNQGTVKSLKEFREIVRVHTVFILFPLLLLFSNISNFFVNFTEMESCCNGILFMNLNDKAMLAFKDHQCLLHIIFTNYQFMYAAHDLLKVRGWPWGEGLVHHQV